MYTTNIATGVKTVSATAAAIFASAERLDRRNKMVVYNEGANSCYWGGEDVEPTTGVTLLPGDSVCFTFDPNREKDYYFVSTSGTTLRVAEVA